MTRSAGHARRRTRLTQTGSDRARPKHARSSKARFAVPLTVLLVTPAAILAQASTAEIRTTPTAAVAQPSPSPSTFLEPTPQRPAFTGSPTANRTKQPAKGRTRLNVSYPDVGSVPGRAVVAYKAAAKRVARSTPGCNLDWSLVGAIGLVETNHGRYAGSSIGRDGAVRPSILGPALTGAGHFARITDSDNGVLDGDTVHDRAVGPMQFIPGTWRSMGRDGDGDGRADPNDIDDAATSAAAYLCHGGRDLSTQSGQIGAVLSYNHSASYVNTVLGVQRAYAGGHFTALPTTYSYPLALPAPAAPAASKKPKPPKTTGTRPTRTPRPTPTKRPHTPSTTPATPSPSPSTGTPDPSPEPAAGSAAVSASASG